MKTLRYKLINGLEIVIGIGQRMIDPVATQKVVKSKVTNWPEFKKVRIESARYLAASKEYSSPTKMKNLLDNIKNAKDAYDIRILKEMPNLIIYFDTRENEKNISDEELEEYKTLIKEASKDNSLVSLDKKKIKNKKGLEYFIKVGDVITKHSIVDINEDMPEGGILKLTKEDEDKFKKAEKKDSIDKLSKKDKEEQFELEKSDIIEKTSHKVLELELGGKTEAEAKKIAFAEHNTKLEDLKKEYKIT